MESDHKDVLISGLKADLYEEKRKGRDLEELVTRFKNLEHRYVLLQEEKKRTEVDFLGKHESNTKKILDLQAHVDSLKVTLYEKDGQVQDARAEVNGLRDLTNQRSNEIARIKRENAEAIEDSDVLSGKRKDYLAHENRLQSEERILVGKLQRANEDLDQMLIEKRDLEREIKEKEALCVELNREIDLAESEGQNLLREAKSADLQLQDAETDNGGLQKEINEMEREIETLEKKNNQMKKNQAQTEGSLEEEKIKNDSLRARIISCENALDHKEAQITELRREIEKAKAEENALLDDGDALGEDLDSLQRHIEEMSLQNRGVKFYKLTFFKQFRKNCVFLFICYK